MPKSRNRKRRNESKVARTRRQRRTASQGRRGHVETPYQVIEMDGRTFARDFEAMLTDEDHQHLLAEIDACAEGDVEAAWHHHTSAPFILESAPTQDLLELRALGDDVPAWAWARWIPRLAYRWMLAAQDPRIRDGVVQALAISHRDLDLDVEPARLYELTTWIGATDWLCEEVCVWDYGGLADYLDVKATQGLLDLAGEVSEWPGSSLGGYLLGRPRGAELAVTELSSGEELSVLNIGAASDGNLGESVIGRLVPIQTEPGLMFVRRPLAVDLELATAVAEATGTEWLIRLSAAADQERWGPDHYAGHTPLTSDLVPEPPCLGQDSEPAGRIQDLMDRGLARPVAEAIGTCEVAFIAAEVAPEGVVGCAPHVGLVIVHPAVFEAAMEHCTAPERERAWRLLAENLADPARSRCLRLAEACRAPEAA